MPDTDGLIACWKADVHYREETVQVGSSKSEYYEKPKILVVISQKMLYDNKQ